MTGFLGRIASAVGGLFAGGAAQNKIRRLEREVGSLRARYESAETTAENQPLWTLTDYLSPRAANSFNVRRTLKIRSRYEAANNSYFRGITNTMAGDLVGTGPRLQVRTPEREVNRQVEAAWGAWSTAVGLADKFRVMAKSKIVDGEGVGLLVTNRELKRTWNTTPGLPHDVRIDVDDAVQLDVIPIESDQVTTPNPGFIDYYWVDGVVLDPLGIPTEYHVLRMHPGDLYMPQLNPLLYDRWAPRNVCHWFRKDRPGQVRGVPEITPSLELFAQLRRYTKAVIAAAEAAADIAWYLKTEMPGDTSPTPPVPFEQLNTDRGVGVTLPWGTDIAQLKAEQPTTTYEMFVRLILREICRCLDIPLCIAMGDSSGYNFASGKLDHLPYWRSINVSRALLIEQVLEKIFVAWLEEAVMIPGLLPRGLKSISDVPHRWFFDSAESIDPVKDATAVQIQLASNTTTLAQEYAERGEDWEEAIRQRGKEISLCNELGITPDQAKPTAGESLPEGRSGKGKAARKEKAHAA